MSKVGAVTLIAIGALAIVIGAPGVYLAVYAYSDLGALSNGSFLLTIGGIAIAAAVGIVAAYSADPGRSRFPSWALSLVILGGSVLAVGYDTVNRMQSERDRVDAQQTQAALRHDNDVLAAQNVQVKKTANQEYAAARALNRGSAQALEAIQRATATAGVINQRTIAAVAQAGNLQSSAVATLLQLMQTLKSNRDLRCGVHHGHPKDRL